MTGRREPELTDALRAALQPLVRELVAEELERISATTTRTDWLTVEEYAEAMRTTPAAVRARLERGQIAGAVKEGRRWLIPSTATAAIVAPPDNNEGRAPSKRPRPGTRR